MAARLRRELGAEVDLTHGRNGEFKVTVDKATVVDGGSLAFLGIMSSAKETVQAVRDAIDQAPKPPSRAPHDKVAACLGQAVDTNRHMHAYRDRRSRLVLFREVDVNTLIEVEIEGRRSIATHIIRAVNRKTFREIHDEIRSFQTHHRTSPESNFIRWFVRLPGYVRGSLLWWLMSDPMMVKRFLGTVSLTAVGMFATGGFWGIPVPNHTLQITPGGIAEKPAVIEGKIQVREYLSLTISVDHDVVDGAPAARFALRFKELIESGVGLSAE